MATVRRLKLWSYWLAALLLCGAALPPAALWQCHHAVQVVGLGKHLAMMPCGEANTLPMPCCRTARALHSPKAPRVAHSAGLPCHPELLRLAGVPALNPTPDLSHRLRFPVALSALPLPATFLPALPQDVPPCRPPPTLGTAQAARNCVPSLRGPPAA